MRNFKKVLALLLSITMVLGLGIGAWADETYTLTYDKNGGSAVPTDSTTAAEKTLTTTGAVHDADADGNAIVIIGWTETADTKIYQASDELNAEHYYANGATITLDETAVTLYALWGLDTNGNGTADVVEEGTTVNVTYDANGGTGAPAAVTTKTGPFTISTTEPTRDGYKFMGWVTGSAPADIAKDGTPEASKNLVASAKKAGGTDNVASETTYYALWAVDENKNDKADYEDTQYTVTYDLNKTPGVGFDGIVREVNTSATVEDDTTYVEGMVGDITGIPATPVTGTIYDEVQDKNVSVVLIGWSVEPNPKAIRAGDTYTSVESITFTDAGLEGFTKDETAVTVYAIWGADEDGDGTADVNEDDANVGSGEDTITIRQNPPAGGTAGVENYEVYKIFDVTKTDAVEENVTTDETVGDTITEEDTGFSYTIAANSPWVAAIGTVAEDGTFTATDGQEWITLTKTADPAKYLVTWKTGVEANETNAKALAEYLLAYAKENEIDPDGEFTTGQTLHTAPGYYLITSSLGTNLVLATTNIDIKTKNDYPSTEKTTPDENSYTVGEQVPFTIKVTLPESVDYTLPVIIHDTMDGHLKLKEDSVTIDGAALAAPHTLDTNPGDDCTFEITLDINSYAPGEGEEKAVKTITVTYTAELLSSDSDESVTVAGTEYVNSEYVQYSDYKTEPSEAKVQTKDWTLKKTFDGKTNEELEATFILVTDVNDESTAIHFILDETGYLKKDTDDTVEDGDTIITVKGTAEGVNIRGFAIDDETTYYLIEKSTSDGYNLLTEPKEVKIDAEGVVITVNNQSGTELPSTGGIGTTIFYIVGGLLAVGAGVVLVAKKRMGKVED